jgi:hypothetical protein
MFVAWSFFESRRFCCLVVSATHVVHIMAQIIARRSYTAHSHSGMNDG